MNETDRSVLRDNFKVMEKMDIPELIELVADLDDIRSGEDRNIKSLRGRVVAGVMKESLLMFAKAELQRQTDEPAIKREAFSNKCMVFTIVISIFALFLYFLSFRSSERRYETNQHLRGKSLSPTGGQALLQ